MATEQSLLERSNGKCELCGAQADLAPYEVEGAVGRDDTAVMLCETCTSQITGSESLDPNHWRALNDSMWSPVPAVQVMAWRMLKRLSEESWAQDLLDMLYLDEELQAWAEAGMASSADDEVVTKDCFGTVLQAGDSVVIIKDLDVKGTSFTAKRGTTVRNISLTDNPEHIEGRVNGTRIVILTKFVKKA